MVLDVVACTVRERPRALLAASVSRPACFRRGAGVACHRARTLYVRGGADAGVMMAVQALMV